MPSTYKELPALIAEKLKSAGLTDERGLLSQGTIGSKAAGKNATKKTIGSAILGVITGVFLGFYSIKTYGAHTACGFAINGNTFYAVPVIFTKKTSIEHINKSKIAFTPDEIKKLYYGKGNKNLFIETITGEVLIITLYKKADPAYYEEIIKTLGGLRTE